MAEPKIVVTFTSDKIDVVLENPAGITNRMFERMIVLARKQLRGSRFQQLHSVKAKEAKAKAEKELAEAQEMPVEEELTFEERLARI